jgi:hypothetical protein
LDRFAGKAVLREGTSLRIKKYTVKEYQQYHLIRCWANSRDPEQKALSVHQQLVDLCKDEQRDLALAARHSAAKTNILAPVCL